MFIFILFYQPFWRMLIVYYLATSLYVMNRYILPTLYQGREPVFQIFMHCFVTFLVFNTFVNYVFCTLVAPGSPSLKVGQDGRQENGGLLPRTVTPILGNNETEINKQGGDFSGSNKSDANEFIVLNMSDKKDHTWSFCEKCETDKPPRAHHCPLCKTCILKRDHHCYLVGNCVGFYNQRYFVVLNFYALFGGLVSLYLTYVHNSAEVFHVLSYADYFFPATIFRWMFGYLSLFQCVVTVHVSLSIVFIVFGLIYFLSQIFIICKGKTYQEYKKVVKMQCSLSMQERFRSVFGDYWLLNFFFPMTFVFKQKGNGTSWKGVNFLTSNSTHLNNNW